MSHYNILDSTAKYALEYLNELSDRKVFPAQSSLQQLENFSDSLPAAGRDHEEILQQLHTAGSQNTVATNGGRYFGSLSDCGQEGLVPLSTVGRTTATGGDRPRSGSCTRPAVGRRAHWKPALHAGTRDYGTLPAA